MPVLSLSPQNQMSPRGKPKGRRVAAYIPEDIAVNLEEWAAEDNRSLSGLITTLLIKAIRERQELQNGAKDHDS